MARNVPWGCGVKDCRYGWGWVTAERTAWVFGLACLVTFGALYLEGAAGARYELERFAALHATSLNEAPSPDLSLWDPKRISAWRSEPRKPAAPPLAVLRVPKIGLEVAVLSGTDEVTLNRAVGHIEDTRIARVGGQHRHRRAPGRLLPGLEGRRSR